MRIAYVEDNPANLALVERVAGMNHHLIVSYNEGEVAMKELTSERFDLILMDVELAGEVGGLEVVRSLRKSGLKTPIVAVTAYAMMGDRDKCLEAGCDDYLPKPLPIVELVALLDRYDELTRHPGTVVAGAVAATHATVVPTTTVPATPRAATSAPLSPVPTTAIPQPTVSTSPVAPLPSVPTPPVPASPAPTASVPPVPAASMPAVPSNPVPVTTSPVVPVTPAEPTPVVNAITPAQTNDKPKETVQPVTQEKPKSDSPVQATPAPKNGQRKESL